jgi:transposase, IS6 family
MLLLTPSVSGLFFKWRQFEPEVILLGGWLVLTVFRCSYRDVEELLAERALLVDHVTVWRWVQRYAPTNKFSTDCDRGSDRPTTVGGWTLTYIRVKGKWVYLYRAVDSSGATIDFLLSAKRDAAAAERFQSQSLGRREPSGATGHQHRQGRSLPTGYRATQIRSCAGGKLLPSTRAVS